MPCTGLASSGLCDLGKSFPFTWCYLQACQCMLSVALHPDLWLGRYANISARGLRFDVASMCKRNGDHGSLELLGKAVWAQDIATQAPM